VKSRTPGVYCWCICWCTRGVPLKLWLRSLWECLVALIALAIHALSPR